MGGNGYYIDHDRLVLTGILLAFFFAYYAYLRATNANRGAWAAYDEIHAHREAVEDDPHGWDHGDVDE